MRKFYNGGATEILESQIRKFSQQFSHFDKASKIQWSKGTNYFLMLMNIMALVNLRKEEIKKIREFFENN